MATKKKRIYASIEKIEPQEDGTLKVWGYASSTAKDSDGEIVTAAAMKAALPSYMKFGAVREMHQASAAGTAIEANVDDATGRTWFGAHVVDPIAVKKVETGVYKGFSIGGKVTKRDELNKSVIRGIDLIEISLVDRPANPEAVLTMYKAARSAEDDVDELADLLDEGTVTPAQVLELVKKSMGKLAEEEPVAKVDKPVKGTGSVEAPPQGVVPQEEPVPPQPETVEKNMHDVTDFALILSQLVNLCGYVQQQAEWDDSESPIPAALKTWVKNGVKLFGEMAADETAALTALLNAKKAAEPDDLVKSDTNGIVAPEPEPEPNNDALQKMVSDAIAPLQESITKLGKENEDLKQQVTTLKKMAAPGKALLRAVALSKAQDVNPEPKSAPEDDAPAENTPERAAYEMAKVFSTGGRRLI